MRRWGLFACACAAAVVMVGCFDQPQPPCSFTCTAAEPTCPDGYVCVEAGGAGRCHLVLSNGQPAVCVEPDAAPDALVVDAPIVVDAVDALVPDAPVVPDATVPDASVPDAL